ncbi:MAG: hypothetical protein N3F10_01485 [Candidatus Bathyarchaeota archaeon]|nr:hypothetical protein [Candidatus Bathyarchaeota archaeon]
MPIPIALVARFFNLIINRQFTEAERELEAIKQKMHKTEWNRGYFEALYGMLLMRKANGSNSDTYAFLAKVDLNDKEALKAYRKEFLSHVKDKLHGDFDRGFFAAWAEFMRVLIKMDLSNIPENLPQQPNEESLDDAKGQTRLEEYLGEE